MRIVTVANKSKYYFPYLKQTCEVNGIPLEVIGMNEHYGGLNWKNDKMIQYLKNIPPETLVCFVDGFDVICTRNLKEMEAVYRQIQMESGCKIAVAEDKRSTLIDWAAYLYFGTCKDKSINSGTYMGYAKDLLGVIEKTFALNTDHDVSDQILLTKYCKANPREFYIDTDAKLFLTLLYPLEDLGPHVSVDGNVVTYKGERPFFIHAPGYGFLDSLLTKMGYSVDPSIQKNLYYDFFVNKILMYIRLVFRLLFWYILAFVVFVLAVCYKGFLYKMVKKLRWTVSVPQTVPRFSRLSSSLR